MINEERFWSKVDKRGAEECWNWKASLFHGYGYYSRQSGSNKAHRVSWEFANGPIPLDKQVLHKCDNKKCVNPNHLYLGTPSDNICDAVTRGRGQFKYLRCMTGYGPKRFRKFV